MAPQLCPRRERSPPTAAPRRARAPPWRDDSGIVAAKRVLNGERMTMPDDADAAAREVMQACWHEEAAARPTMATLVERLRAAWPDATDGV